MASAPSISFCNARQPLRLPTHDLSNVFSSCGTLEDMVASCTAGATPPFIQGPAISSMVNNRVDEGRGRKRLEPAMEAGICRGGGGGGGYGGYNGRSQVRGGRGEEGDEMQGGGIRGDDEEEEEEESEEEILAYREKQGGRWSSRVSAGGEEAGEEQLGNVTWKKRKLSAEQVRCLERSFEVERKLEGQRKAELASQLRLEPRQIAVWFQNRRARWKSKQLEHDYLALQASFASLQAHFDALLAQKHDLLRQVDALRSKLQQGDGPLKYDVDTSTNFERGIQKENVDQEHEKLAFVDIAATRETHGLDPTRVIKEKGDMAKKDKQSDKGRINEVTNKLELSTLSSTEGSVVSEAINSPRAIESRVIDSQGPLINPSLIKNDANSSLSSLLPITHLPTQAPPLALGTLDLFNLNNEYIKVEPTQEEDIETQHKYCFILEEHPEGNFPWWN